MAEPQPVHSRTAGDSGGPIRRTWHHVRVHAIYLTSLVLGDDWLSRRIRLFLLRRAGAAIAPGTSFHGGTYMTNPRNLRVGRDTFFNRSCYLDLAAPIIVGDHVRVGHGVTLITVEHGYRPDELGLNIFKPIVLKDRSWIGANATVMPGVTVGRWSVVAAGSLVTRDVPDGWVVGGVPARFLKDGADGSVTAGSVAANSEGGQDDESTGPSLAPMA